MITDKAARHLEAPNSVAEKSAQRSSQVRRPNGYFFLTPVWGDTFTRLYIDVVIPSQLAPGNLDVFQNEQNCRYIIYTRPQDAKVIGSSPIFKQLNAFVPV